MSAFRLAVVIICLGMTQAPALASGNAEAGKAKATQVCGACHGPDGNKPSAPDQPVLAGQYYDYLVRALSDYKSGKRKNAIMNPMASQLSAQDIQDVATWFSSQSATSLHNQR